MSNFVCNPLVRIISFLACAIIAKYARGRVKENQAKKVSLRLELTITQLLKRFFFFPYVKDIARFFALLGIFIWKDFHTVVLITKSNPQIDVYVNKNCSESKRENWTLQKFQSDTNLFINIHWVSVGSTLFSWVFEISGLFCQLRELEYAFIDSLTLVK